MGFLIAHGRHSERVIHVDDVDLDMVALRCEGTPDEESVRRGYIPAHLLPDEVIRRLAAAGDMGAQRTLAERNLAPMSGPTEGQRRQPKVLDAFRRLGKSQDPLSFTDQRRSQ